MALKTFEIEWKGQKTEIEYDDDISFGKMETILKKCVDLKNVAQPEVNISEYRRMILMNVLTKAPFPTHDPIAISNIPRKVAEKIIGEVMDDYPLAASLEGWMTSFLGSVTLNASLQTPTPSVPTNTDGIKKQQTNKKQNGSKGQSQQPQSN
jgi:hypothetical protein